MFFTIKYANSELLIIDQKKDGLDIFSAKSLDANWRYLSIIPEFGINQGWGIYHQHLHTIQATVVANKLYILGRGVLGVVLYEFLPLSKQSIVRASLPQFTNAQGWHYSPSYYETIQFIAIGEKLFLLGRAAKGVILYEYDTRTNKWKNCAMLAQFTDAQGWPASESYYKTIQSLVIGNKIYVLGRGSKCIVLSEYDTKTDKWRDCTSLSAFTDAQGWPILPCYYKTIQSSVIDNKLYVLGRGKSGLQLYEYSPEVDNWRSCSTIEVFTEAQGWSSDPSYYESIQSIVIDNKLFVLGSGLDNLYVYQFTSATNQWKPCTTPGERGTLFNKKLKYIQVDDIGNSRLLVSALDTENKCISIQYDTINNRWQNTSDCVGTNVHVVIQASTQVKKTCGIESPQPPVNLSTSKPETPHTATKAPDANKLISPCVVNTSDLKAGTSGLIHANPPESADMSSTASHIAQGVDNENHSHVTQIANELMELEKQFNDIINRERTQNARSLNLFTRNSQLSKLQLDQIKQLKTSYISKLKSLSVIERNAPEILQLLEKSADKEGVKLIDFHLGITKLSALGNTSSRGEVDKLIMRR